MKRILILFALVISVASFADPIRWYLVVPANQEQSIMGRLDVLVQGIPGTVHYTAPIQPQNPEYPFVLLPLDARAESVITPEEWASRLATMPIEFVPPDPIGGQP